MGKQGQLAVVTENNLLTCNQHYHSDSQAKQQNFTQTKEHAAKFKLHYLGSEAPDKYYFIATIGATGVRCYKLDLIESSQPSSPQVHWMTERRRDGVIVQ